jgi:integrase
MASATSVRTPRYRKHRPSGQAVVTLSGKDRYLGKYGTKASKSEYDRLIAEWLNAGRQLLPDDGQPVTVNDLILGFWNATHKNLKGGRAFNLRSAMRVLRALYGTTTADSFGPKALGVVREAMKKEVCKKTKLPWSRTYINLELDWIRRLFSWAVSQELVEGSKSHALAEVPNVAKGEARESEPIGPVDDAIVEATLPYLPPVLVTIVKIQRLAGCRPQEVCRLSADGLDMSCENVWTYRPREHKGSHLDKDRIIHFGPKAIELIRPYLRADGLPFFRPVESESARNEARRDKRKTPMTPSHLRRRQRKKSRTRAPGDYYTTGAYRQCIIRACKKAEIEPWAPNQLRHAAATEIRAKFGLEAAQIALGHSRADVTQVYAERNSKLGAEVARKIG